MIGRESASRGRRVRACALGTSAIALGMLWTGAAAAQCAPDPTVAGGTTTCTGTDADGLVVATDNTRVVVAPDAIVRAGTSAAGIVTRGNSVSLAVNGLVDGGVGKPGVFVTTGPATSVPCDPYAGASVGYCVPGSTVTSYPGASVTIEIGAGRTVTGAQGVLIRRDPTNSNGFIGASITNAGRITGTTGPAVVADGLGSGTLSITNAATGRIDGIAGQLSFLNNAGLVDGGTNAALAATAGPFASGLTVTNTGRIVSNGAAATLSSAGFLSVTNASGATIGGSGTAISTAGTLFLTNAGTIAGSVVSTAGNGTTSTIDTRTGTIIGELRLGAGNDTLRARFDPTTGRVSSVTGGIDGGAGTDTLAIGIDADTSIGRAVLPTNFELLGLDLSNNATATLLPGFTTGSGIALSGQGALINRADLVTAGPAITASSSFGLAVTNAGTITASFGSGDTFRAAVGSPATVTNTGTITANGGAGVQAYQALTNSGTISATGTAASVSFGALANTGAIRSNGGVGALISGNGVGSASTNDGTIAGASTGVTLSGGRLVNRGGITGGTSGVTLYGTLVNEASGRISGGNLAVAGSGSPSAVLNAGTITGTVSFVSPFSFDGAADVFVDNGGTVAGAIRLGGGDDTLVVTLPGAGGIDPARPLAGATGGVDAGAGYDTLRYRVNADADVALAPAFGFEGLGYELNGAALRVTAATPVTTTIGLAGNGSVTLNGAVSTTDRTLIDATVLTVDQLANGTAGPARALAITNAGTLTLTTTAQNNNFITLAAINAGTPPYGTVETTGGNTVTNTGTITVGNVPGRFPAAFGILGGTVVTNAGTIGLTGGGTAINGARDVTNTGTITGTITGAAGAAVTGVAGFTTLTNSGTISVDGTAVQGSGFVVGGRITNTGTIESRAGIAVQPGYGIPLVNEATGTIRGDTAVDLSGGTVINRGAIVGNVRSGFSAFTGSSYVADGGTLTGNLVFGGYNDTLVAFADDFGITGTVDGGAGIDTLIRARRASGTVTLGLAGVTGFEQQGVRALGADTIVTVRADALVAGDLLVSGDGAVINTAAIDGAVTTYASYIAPGGDPSLPADAVLAGFTNSGTIALGFTGTTRAFANSGAIGAGPSGEAVSIAITDTLRFDNSGSITGGPSDFATPAVSLYGNQAARSITAANAGTITGGIQATLPGYRDFGQSPPDYPLAISLTNTGTITAAGISGTGADGFGAYLALDLETGQAGSVTFTNAGIIDAGGDGASAAYLSTSRVFGSTPGPATITATNSGTLRANGGGSERDFGSPTRPLLYTVPAVALQLEGLAGSTTVATNDAAGLIEATGVRSAAVMNNQAALDLTNAGTIRGSAGTTLAANDQLGRILGRAYLAGAIQTIGSADDRIVNTGTIIGSVDLGAGNDRVENRGRIEGDVFLGAGDDSFLHLASAVLTGTVDGGAGTDSLVIDATGGGTVDGDRFIGFERFGQTGQGTVAYLGTFRFDTIGLMGGGVTVAAGQTLASDGAVTITGTDADETVTNDGTIAGSVSLAGGNDRVVNRGRIAGAVLLGEGDDGFVEGPGSSVAGGVDGGAGNDGYTVVLAGNRTGLAPRTGFERLAVEGTGVLDLTLDQRFDTATLAGTGLNLALNGYTVGAVTGTDAAETLGVDGDLASVSLGGGNDTLALGAARAAGVYAGGAGADTLRFTATGPVTLAGTATGFERVALAGGALTVAGTLGSAATPLAFGDGAQQLTLANGGTLAGVIDLGAGNDAFRWAAGGILAGTLAGGAGTDTATLDLAGDRTLAGGTLSGFELLEVQGTGTLMLTGTHAFDRVGSATELAVAAGGSLAAPVQFGAGDQRFTIAGGYAGAVDGGAGVDTIAVSGGTAAAPVAFTTVTGIESYGQTGGYATVSGNAALGSVDMSDGRLVGLSGSTITAAQIAVRQGATFGSAGTVTGNLAVAGTLSPGASPGVMTVNGNVAIQSGSVSVFELTPTVSDQLRVNGAVTIATGATLQLVPTGALRPGTSYDLIVASGGITGSYSTVQKPDSLFGFVVQRADRIQLLGQFLGDPGFSPQVTRSVAYANATLAVQPATSTLFASLPALLTTVGTSNPRAFAQLTPEAYASATQAGVDNALLLTGAARGPAFTTTRDTPGLFAFGQGVGQWHTLGADRGQGTSSARTRGYGLLGGIGFGDADWSVGAFGGWLNTRQSIGALGAQTQGDGVVAGIHGRYTREAFALTASVLYDGGDAHTTRALPGSAPARGRYDLDSWVADLSLGYGLDMGEWALRPKVGVTYLRTTRDGLVEQGGPFALTVARDRHVAGFADAGIGFGRSEASPAPFRPFVSLGVRYQLEGRRTDALAGYAGGGLGLEALGAARSRVVGTASAGVAYRFANDLDLFSTAAAQTGRDDHAETISTGVRFRF